MTLAGETEKMRMEAQEGRVVGATEALLERIVEGWLEKTRRRLQFDGESSLKIVIRQGRMADVHTDEHQHLRQAQPR